MLDDSKLRKIRITFRVEPKWARSVINTEDPIKLPHSKQYCNCCNCDYFRNRWLTDVALSRPLQVGKGDENREMTDFACLMRTCRNGSYKLWSTYLSSILPPSQHGWLNECIVTMVKKFYPDPHKDYMGYPYTIDHMNHMIALKRGVDKAAESSSCSSSDDEFIEEPL